LNIYAVIELLQTIQSDSEIEIQRLKSGGRPVLVPLKFRRLEEKIVNLKSKLAARSITVTEYMDAISSVFHLE
jgi:hypothetical protein